MGSNYAVGVILSESDTGLSLNSMGANVSWVAQASIVSTPLYPKKTIENHQTEQQNSLKCEEDELDGGQIKEGMSMNMLIGDIRPS